MNERVLIAFGEKALPQYMRAMFAAQAPAVPNWFKHVEPPKDYPAAPDFLALSPEDQRAVNDWRGGNSDIPEHLQWFKVAEDAHYSKAREWTNNDQLARQVQWRWFYANAMMQERYMDRRKA